jgi:hypothetical protein
MKSVKNNRKGVLGRDTRNDEIGSIAVETDILLRFRLVGVNLKESMSKVVEVK